MSNHLVISSGATVIGPTCGGEVPLEFVADVHHPRRQGTEHHRGVEHLVVVRERVDRDRVQACLCRHARVDAGRGGDGLQLLPVDAAGPVGLDRPLEFAFRSDAGEPGIVAANGVLVTVTATFLHM